MAELCPLSNQAVPSLPVGRPAVGSAPDGNAGDQKAASEAPPADLYMGRPRRPSVTQRVSKGASRVMQTLSKVPQSYRYVPRLLRFAVVETAVTALQLTAGVTGVAAVFGMGLAGGLELKDGIRDRDAVKVVDGAAEMTKGLALGAVTATEYLDIGPHQGNLQTAAKGLAVVHGALSLASGAIKLQRGHKFHKPRLYVEGILEMAAAGATVAAAGGIAPGPMLGIAVALNLADAVYANQDKIRSAAKAVSGRVRQIWNNFKDVFRDDEPKKPT